VLIGVFSLLHREKIVDAPTIFSKQRHELSLQSSPKKRFAVLRNIAQAFPFLAIGMTRHAAFICM
jgi:hypothetical protein